MDIDEETVMECSQCGRLFESQADLERHMRDEHGIDERPQDTAS